MPSTRLKETCRQITIFEMFMIFSSTASNSTLGLIKQTKSYYQPGLEDEDDLEKGGHICCPHSEGKEDLMELLDDNNHVEGKGPMDGPKSHGDANGHDVDVPKEN